MHSTFSNKYRIHLTFVTLAVIMTITFGEGVNTTSDSVSPRFARSLDQISNLQTRLLSTSKGVSCSETTSFPFELSHLCKLCSTRCALQVQVSCCVNCAPKSIQKWTRTHLSSYSHPCRSWHTKIHQNL